VTRARAGAGALACACALLLGACGRAYVYPDLSEPERTLRTFEQAWKMGDVDVLERVYTGIPLIDLRAQIQKNGRDAVRDYYRKDADAVAFEVGDAVEGEHVTYLSVRVRTGRAGAKPVAYRFALARVGEEWKISNFVAEAGQGQ